MQPIRRLITVSVAVLVAVGAGVAFKPPPTPAPSGLAVTATPKPVFTTVIQQRQVFDNPAKYIVLHHQAGAAWTNKAQPWEWFKSQGYQDVAYNVMFTPGGDLWQGRGEQFQSAANLGINPYAVAGCFLGNLDEHPATDAQIITAGGWVRGALKRHPGAKLIQHKDAARIANDFRDSTGCPGRYATKTNLARAVFLVASGFPLADAKRRALAELR